MAVSASKPQPVLTGIYPIRGILHLIHHSRRLGGPVLVSTAKACVVSLLALIPLFQVGYQWQGRLIGQLYRNMLQDEQTNIFASLVRTAGPGMTAAVTSGILCLAESFMITSSVSQYFIGSLRERLFDAILEEHGITVPPPPSPASSSSSSQPSSSSVSKEKQDKHAPGYQHGHAQAITETVEEWMIEKLDVTGLPKTPKEMEKAAKWWLSGSHIMGVCAKKEAKDFPLNWVPSLVYVVSLPLNFIPLIGPLAFLGMQGICQGGVAHRRYFDLFRWSNQRRVHHIQHHYWHYHQFGMVSSALEMIPFVGFFCSYTNQIGAALWVVDWRKKNVM